MPMKIECPACEGRGMRRTDWPRAGRKECEVCHYSGEITVHTQAEYDAAVKAAKITEGQRIINKLRRRMYQWSGSERGFINHKPVYIPAPKVLEWLIKEFKNG